MSCPGSQLLVIWFLIFLLKAATLKMEFSEKYHSSDTSYWRAEYGCRSTLPPKICVNSPQDTLAVVLVGASLSTGGRAMVLAAPRRSCRVSVNIQVKLAEGNVKL